MDFFVVQWFNPRELRQTSEPQPSLKLQEGMMYTLLRRAGLHESLLVEAPSLVVSLVLAELFYKFHSFTLECLAFLATWLVVSSVVGLASGSWSRRDAA
jgi:hypothetical protein